MAAAASADWGVFYSFVYQDGRVAYGVDHTRIMLDAQMDTSRPYIVGAVVGKTQGELYAEFYPDGDFENEQLKADALASLMRSFGRISVQLTAKSVSSGLRSPRSTARSTVTHVMPRWWAVEGGATGSPPTFPSVPNAASRSSPRPPLDEAARFRARPPGSVCQPPWPANWIFLPGFVHCSGIVYFGTLNLPDVHLKPSVVLPTCRGQ